MRIGLDCSYIGRAITGIESYSLALRTALRRVSSHHEIIDVLPGTSVPRFATSHRIFREQVLVPLEMRKLRIDCPVYSAFPPGFATGNPFAAVIHDIVPWAYPHTMSPFGRVYLAPAIRRAARRARLVFTVSETVRRELLGILHRDPETVVHIGAATVPAQRTDPALAQSVLARLGVIEPYLLAVGSIEPRKNYPALLDVIRAGCEGVQLVIAGRRAWGWPEIEPLLPSFGTRVRVIGYVPPNDLAVLYQRAALYIQASVYEGFGLPLLEAMSYGVPVVANDIPVFREKATPAVLMDFTKPGQVAAKIRELLNDSESCECLRQAGLSCTSKDSWDAVARRALGGIEEWFVAAK